MKAFKSLPYESFARGAILTSLLNTARCDRNELGKTKSGQSVGPIYSHVILGFGTAGNAAVDQLLKFGHPLDSILVVDPQIELKTYNFNPRKEKRLTFHASSAANIDVAHKIIQLADGSRIHYQNCLVSVGSASAPFQPAFVDADCDLQRTVVDLTKLNAPYDLYRTLTKRAEASSVSPTVPNSLSYPRPTSIAVVGANSFETVELAGKLAIAAAQENFAVVEAQMQQQRNKQSAKEAISVSALPKNPKSTNNNNNSSTKKTDKESSRIKVENVAVPKDSVILIYPGYGPMSHSLPRYLSLAVAKRLQSLGVQLVPYSYVRYLGATDTSTVSTKTTSNVKNNNIYSTSNSTRSATNADVSPQLVLFLAKTYDSLNTTSLVADKVTFAPTSVPTIADRKLHHSALSEYDETHCAMQVNQTHPHSFLLRSGLELDNISGGVVVNQSLQACKGVYVAGDVASVCNNGNGVDLRETAECHSMQKSKNHVIQQRGVIRGYENALYSGTLAGRNMAYNSTHRTANDNQSETTDVSTALLYNHVPVYEAHSADIGVHLTFIGNCSTALESHGYWWKLGTNPVNTTSSNTDTLSRPPLGLGVVFYVDNNGVINGILVSGLPHTSNPRTTSDTSATDNREGPKAKYYGRVNELCKQMIGKSIKSLDQVAINGNNGNGTVYKRINLTESFLTAPESEVLPPDESDVHAQLVQNEKASVEDITSTSMDASSTPSTPIDSTISAINYGTEIYTSQALSWEARRLLSPVLTPVLYKNVTVTTEDDLTTHMVNMPTTAAVFQAAQHYPRPLYRYCGPSHTTIKDLSEPHKETIVRPMVAREQLFQPEFANTGSKADNLQTAYKRSMAKNLF